MNDIQMHVSTGTLTEIIFGINQVSAGMEQAVFDSTLEGIYTKRPELPDETNARIFLDSYFDLTAGAFRLIAAASDILCTALVNMEIDIVSSDDAKKIQQLNERGTQE